MIPNFWRLEKLLAHWIVYAFSTRDSTIARGKWGDDPCFPRSRGGRDPKWDDFAIWLNSGAGGAGLSLTSAGYFW